MYNVNSASANWDIFTGKQNNGNKGIENDIFGPSFKSILQGQKSIEDIFDKLAERFSSADVSVGKPGKGSQGTQDYFGNNEGDKVAVEQGLLEAMFGNSGLANKVNDAIAAFFDSAAGSASQPGSYTQRSVSISITAVRYNVSQFDSESGDIMSAQEMLTSLQEQMSDLVNRFFGGSEESGSEGAENGGKAQDSSSFNAKGFSFSMEMFFSSQMINSMGGNGQGQGSQFSLSALAMGGSWQNFSGNALPSALYDALANNNDFSGPFTSLLDEGLGQFGMTNGGFDFSAGGFSLKANSSEYSLQDFLNELLKNRHDKMDTHGKAEEAKDKKNDKAEENVETVEDVEEMAEAAVE